MKMWIGFRTILVVSLPCMATATIHEGDYELQSSDEVLPFTKITGCLTFAEDYSGDAGTNLPCLEEVNDILSEEDTQVESIFLPELVKICDMFCSTDNKHLKEIRLPKLTSVGNWSVMKSLNLETLFVPQLKEVAEDIENSETKLKQVSFPALEQIGGNCGISRNDHLEELHLPNLKTVGNLKELHDPNKEFANYLHICKSDKLKYINLPKLETVVGNFLSSSDSVEFVHLPELKTMSDGSNIEHGLQFAKLYVLPKLLAPDFRYSSKHWKWKIEKFRFSQQANDTSALAIVLGINCFGKVIAREYASSFFNFPILIRKKRDQDVRNLFSLDDLVLRNIFLMLQPSSRKRFDGLSPRDMITDILETRILLRKYKYILDQMS